MTIIRHGRFHLYQLKFKCRQCGCVFTSRIAETQRDENSEIYNARCPECGTDVATREMIEVLK